MFGKHFQLNEQTLSIVEEIGRHIYQAHTDMEDGLRVGEHFPYLQTFTAYAEKYITEQYREEFLRFIEPDAIRKTGTITWHMPSGHALQMWMQRPAPRSKA